MITACVCLSYKRELFATGDTYKCALYPSSATLSKATTAYRATDEVSGQGYTPGGATLTGMTVALDGDAACLTFANPTWPSATIAARGALIYNASKANKAVAVLDFGETVTSTNGLYTVVLPLPVVKLT